MKFFNLMAVTQERGNEEGSAINNYDDVFDDLIHIIGRLKMFGDILASFGDDVDSLGKGTVVTMGLSMTDDARKGNELLSKLICENVEQEEKQG